MIRLFLSMFLTLCSTGHADASDGWRIGSLAGQGLDADAIAECLARIRYGEYKNLHSFLIARRGILVLEEYFAGTDGWRGHVVFDKDQLHDTRSVSKSVTSALVGIAIDKGFIDSVDVPMHQFFPDHSAHITEEKKQITLRHLLTMTSGFRWDQSGAHKSEPGSPNSEAQMENSYDFIGYVLSADMSDEPGRRFNYNSGCAILLAGVIKKVSGLHADAFANEYLFGTLGIRRSDWWRTKTGLPQTHAGLRLRPRGLAKIGQLYLDRGVWNGVEVLPAEWIEESVSPQFGNERYGFGWWLDRFSVAGHPVKTFVAEGNGGQFLFVIPDVEMVIVFTGGNYGSAVANQVFRIVTRHVLPAVIDHPSESGGQADGGMDSED